MSPRPVIASRTGTDDIQAQYVITIRENGGLQVEGQIENKEYTIAVLENAIQAVKDYHGKKGLLVPGKNVSL